MKNIHILQTNEPTRIFETNTGLQFSIIDKVRVGEYKGFHIYITSDEEIKDIRPYKGKWQLEKGHILNKFPTYLTDLSECKLIIITTDPTLIADGVQAINDEFVEWFVKNSSCEWVDVKYKYWKEINDIGKYTYKIIIPKEEPKKETLEEAAISYAVDVNTKMGGNKEAYQNCSRLDFIAGANWKAQRMYSEDDVDELVNNLIDKFLNYNGSSVDNEKLKWFYQQIKKK